MSGYPRKELCPCCEVVEVDVIGPGDTWSLCHLCHLALMDEKVMTLAEMLREEEKHYLAMMKDPELSDDAIADTVLALRRVRGEQPLTEVV